jgi:hypothetical protein
MTVISESDTVIVTTDGRARLNVQKLFDKQHVKDSLKEMREKIQNSSQAAALPESNPPKPLQS